MDAECIKPLAKRSLPKTIVAVMTWRNHTNGTERSFFSKQIDKNLTNLWFGLDGSISPTQIFRHPKATSWLSLLRHLP